MFEIDLETLRQQGDQTRDYDDSVDLFDLTDEQWTFHGNVTGRLRFHLVGEDVHMRGTLSASAVGQCVRSLEDVPVEVTAKVNYLYAPAHTMPTGDLAHENVHVEDRDVPETAYYQHKRIEPLEQMREAILLELPDFPHTAAALEHIDEVITFGGTDEKVEPTAPTPEEPEWKKKLRAMKREVG